MFVHDSITNLVTLLPPPPPPPPMIFLLSHVHDTPTILILVINYTSCSRQSLSAVAIGSRYRQSLSAVAVGSRCRQSLSAVAVGSRCRQSLSAVAIDSCYQPVFPMIRDPLCQGRYFHVHIVTHSDTYTTDYRVPCHYTVTTDIVSSMPLHCDYRLQSSMPLHCDYRHSEFHATTL